MAPAGNTDVNQPAGTQIPHTIYTQQQFDTVYEAIPEEGCSGKIIFKNAINQVKSLKFWKNQVKTKIPVITWLQSYQASWLVSDIVAGLTVASMNIPQSLAYGLLSGLPAVYGLYSSFYGVILYFIFGTSHFVSIGTAAPMSLLLADISEAVKKPANMSLHGCQDCASDTHEDLEEEWNERKVKVIMAVTLMAGLMQLLMAILHLGFLAEYFSKALISGFTWGSAVQIATSQLTHIFGIRVKEVVEPFAIFQKWYGIAQHAKDVNVCTLIISITAITSIYVTKRLNQKFKSKLRFPIPIELIVLVVSILTVYLGKLAKRFNVAVVGDIQRGLPRPQVPEIPGLGQEMDDYFPASTAYSKSAVFAIFSFALTLAMGKTVGVNHPENVIVAKQEILALGLANTIGSFFKGFIVSGSPSRSIVQENVGCKTQITGLVTAVVTLIVLYVASQLFYYLPLAILASIILVAISSLFKKITELKGFYTSSLSDAIVWISAALGVATLGVDTGLFAGALVGVLTVLARCHTAHCSLMGRLPNTEAGAYWDVNRYKKCRPVPGLAIFRLNVPLTFLNVEEFTCNFYRTMNIDIAHMLQAKKEAEEGLLSPHQTNEEDNPWLNGDIQTAFDGRRKGYLLLNEDSERNETREKNDESSIHTVIFDCEAISYTDSMGMDALLKIHKELESVGIQLLYSNAKYPLVAQLSRAGFFKKIDSNFFYPSTNNAVLACLKIKEEELDEMMQD